MALPTLKSEHNTTKRVIEAIPLDKGDYRPDAVSKSALELAWHIVASEKRFFSGIPIGAFDFTAIHRPDSITNSAGIVAWFEETFAANLAECSRRPAGKHWRGWWTSAGMFQLPAVSFIHLALNHSIHHRGQLSMYLRPMGAKVPAIYGESYDTTQARLAKEGKAS